MVVVVGIGIANNRLSHHPTWAFKILHGSRISSTYMNTQKEQGEFRESTEPTEKRDEEKKTSLDLAISQLQGPLLHDFLEITFQQVSE